MDSVASLGWVTPGAATEGVTPLFFPEKPGDIFFSSLSLSLSLFIAFTWVSHPPGCHPHLFYLSDLVSPLFFVNLPTKIFFLRVSPLWRVSPGAVLPTPPSDATGWIYHRRSQWLAHVGYDACRSCGLATVFTLRHYMCTFMLLSMCPASIACLLSVNSNAYHASPHKL